MYLSILQVFVPELLATLNLIIRNVWLSNVLEKPAIQGMLVWYLYVHVYFNQ